VSRHLVSLVYSKRVGSAIRKAVIVYCADRASDGGDGIWCSKQTIADEIEAARSTVIKTINEFLAEGLLSKVGSRPCTNGATTEYRINVTVLGALPDCRERGGRSFLQTLTSARRTSHAGGHPSDGRTPPVRGPNPMASESQTQTVPEPSLNHPKDLREPAFSDFWAIWPNRVAKAEAERAWKKLSAPDRAEATRLAPSWFTAWQARHPKASPIYPGTYLNKRRWQDEMDTASNEKKAKIERYRKMGR
jgi:hypothetical protein